MNRLLRRLINWSVNICFVILLLVVVHYVRRVFIADQFVIPTNSMLPTLESGDRVIVNKLIFGARVYKSLDFLSGKEKMMSFRMRGWRGVVHNDIVVFNFPRQKEKMGFKINHVYAKRCVGVPGDTVSVVNGYFRSSGYEGCIGIESKQRHLSNVELANLPPGVPYAFPFRKEFDWTIKEMGPLYVPRKGDVIHMDKMNFYLYRDVIDYETGKKIDIDKVGVVNLEGVPLESYQFQENYYFMCGDDVMNSQDSRYVGFVPEEFIVGIVSHITYSKDKKGAFRWDRVGKSVMKGEVTR